MPALRLLLILSIFSAICPPLSADPVITTATPAVIVARSAPVSIVVTGSGFVPGSQVRLDGAALPTSFISATQVIGYFDNRNALAGSVTIVVWNPGLGPPISNSVLITISANITSVDPAAATAGAGPTTIALTGFGFTSACLVSLGSAAKKWDLQTTVESSTSLVAVVPADALLQLAQLDLSMSCAPGWHSTFNVIGPSILTVEPHEAAAATPNLQLSVHGSGFLPSSHVNWNGASLVTTYVGPENLAATVPVSLLTAPSTANLSVSTGSFTSTAYPFSVHGPAISRLSPTSIPVGAKALYLTVDGSWFLSTSTIYFKGVALPTSRINTSRLWASVPSSLLVDAGPAAVTVKNGSAASDPAIFTISGPPPPIIESVTPKSLPVTTASTILTVTGIPFVNGATIRWNGTPLTTTFVSATQLTAFLPSAPTPGQFAVSVSNPDGSPSLDFPISVMAPQLTEIFRAPVFTEDGSLPLDVWGSNFAPMSVVNWNGTPIPTTYVASPYQESFLLGAKVPKNLLTTGSGAVTVSTGSVTSNAITFAVPGIPTITAITPDSLDAGGPAALLTVTGAHFVQGSHFLFDSVTLTPSSITDTQFTVLIPPDAISVAGPKWILILNPDNTPSDPNPPFPVNPVLNTVTPTEAPVGAGPLTIQLSGVGFREDAQVQYAKTNGPQLLLPATVQSSSRLSVTLPSEALNELVPAKITVFVSDTHSAPLDFALHGPAISHLSPTSAAAGTSSLQLTVDGSWFVPTSTVYFNGAAVPTTFVSQTRLQATVPGNLLAAGSAAVTVKTGSAASTPAAFTVDAPPPPTIESVAPNPIPVATTPTTLTVTGAHFLNGATVRWNGTPLTTTFVSATQLTAILPSAPTPGQFAISVSIPDGPPSDDFPIAVTAPQITEVLRAPVITEDGSLPLDVWGSSFSPMSVVNWNGTPIPTTYVASPYQESFLLGAKVPKNLLTTGSGTVTVSTGSVTSNAVTFAVPGIPTIIAITPDSLDAGGPAALLTVTGAHFVQGSHFLFDNLTLTPTSITDTQFTVLIPPDAISVAGPKWILILNPDNTPSDPNPPFPVNPVLNAITPTEAPVGSGPLTIQLSGAGFREDAQVQYAKTNGPQLLLPAAFQSSSRISVTLPPEALDELVPGKITVFVADTHSTALDFSLHAPAISKLSPTSAPPETTNLELTVDGSWFVPASIVYFKGSPLPTTFVSQTKLRAAVPVGLLTTPGAASVTVQTGAAASNSAEFTISDATAPAIDSVTPNPLTATTSSVTLTITGARFQTGATVRWSGQPLPTTFISPTQLTAALAPPHAQTAGQFAVSVSNPDGSTSPDLPVLVNPLLISISPSDFAVGDSPTISASGSGIAPGSALRISNAGSNWTIPATLDNNTLTAKLPADVFASPATAALSIVNTSSGTASNSLPFTINAPAIATLAPSSAHVNAQGFQLQLIGSWFAASSTVYWDTTALITAHSSSKELLAIVPASLLTQARDAKITVSTGTVVSSPILFPIVNGPSIIQISPDSFTPAAVDLPHFVTGDGFSTAAVVHWAGSPLATTAVTQRILTAKVPAAALALAGRVQVTVVNPDGVASSPFPVEISPRLDSVTPATVSVGAPATTITLSGAGFSPHAAVFLDSNVLLTTTYIDPSTLRAVIPPEQLVLERHTTLHIVDTDGVASAQIPFVIARTDGPVLTTLLPDHTAAGISSFLLTVQGSGFLPGSDILWAGQPITTTYVSASELTAPVPASFLEQEAFVSITVTGSNGTSNALTFQILDGLPVISEGGIVNVFAPVQKFAPGSLISIYGVNFTGDKGPVAASPQRAALGETFVRLNGATIPLLFVGQNQINAQLPFDLPPGSATIVVEAHGWQSDPAEIQVDTTAPVVLADWPGAHAIAINAAAGSMNSPDSPAAPGGYVTIFLTGQGAVNPPIPTGSNAPSDPLSWTVAPTVATLGGKPVEITYSGLAPGFVGLAQVNLIVPDLPTGEHTLILSIGAAADPVTLSVRTK